MNNFTVILEEFHCRCITSKATWGLVFYIIKRPKGSVVPSFSFASYARELLASSTRVLFSILLCLGTMILSKAVGLEQEQR